MSQRCRITIRGGVQGVGFRPFVYRLASEMKLPGWVSNSPLGVFIEVEGEKQTLSAFLPRLEREKPPRSFIHSLEFSFLDPVGYRSFDIRPSETVGDKTTLVLPDIATCRDCLGDILTPGDRRYRYPFTNCTNCGPRFTIIEALPYDRPNTSMRAFTMCAECRREYRDPTDRRFHAQPIACPACGPQLELWDPLGNTVSTHDDALRQAAAEIRAGAIVALKGLGGFHLLVDARNEPGVARLRLRKHREEKPFALMVPNLDSVRAACEVGPLEERLLSSAESPIVLLRRRRTERPEMAVAANVAPQNPYLGVMLPYTPLHHLLMRDLGFPVVATSGNLSDEPISTDEDEALVRLRHIADWFLVHNRPIVRHMDDSIVRVILDRELVLRRARGYAPLPLRLETPMPEVLAVGGHLKNTVALTIGRHVFISQHIGDLENQEASEAFRKVIASFQTLYDTQPRQIIADMHPDYLSTKFAQGYGRPLVTIQHHYAHVAACMAENELQGRVLGVSWDGTGYGLDGTIWGGEFLLADETSFRRVATFRTFRLPGGARAVREPRRAAVGALYEILGDNLFDSSSLIPIRSFAGSELAALRRMLNRSVNSPLCSSVGRLFDVVASLTGLRQRVNYEGQAAMELEFAVEDHATEETYPFRIEQTLQIGDNPRTVPVCSSSQNLLVVDWKPLVLEIIEDLRKGAAIPIVSTKFHNTLVEVIVEIARRVGERRVVLTGGCFQNRYLTERSVRRLEAGGFRTYWHQRIPPNDGGIAPGQAVAAARLLESTERQAMDSGYHEEVEPVQVGASARATCRSPLH